MDTGIVMPDWIKWAGIPEVFFFCLLLLEQEEETWLTDQTLHNTNYLWKIELFLHLFQ